MSESLPKVAVARENDGVTLLCHARRDIPVVSAAINIPGGNLYNPVRRPGLAAVATDLLGECPAGTSPAEWRRVTERLATEISFDSGPSSSTIRFSCLSENLDEVFGLAGRIMREPALPRSEWKRLVKTYRASAREQWAQPAGVIHHLAAVQNLGFGHPLAHPSFEKGFAGVPYGEGASVALRTLEKQPGAWATIGGDVDPSDGFRRLRELVANLRPAKTAVDFNPPPRPSAARTWIADNRKVDQAFFALGRPGIAGGDPDRVALRLANFLIGGGAFQSRLMDRVRETAGGTYGIGSQLPEYRMVSPFMISSFTETSRLREMLDIVSRTLAQIAADGFTEQELETARSNLYGCVPLRLTSPESIVSWFAYGLDVGLAPEDTERDWRSYMTTPLDAVNRAARRIIGDGQFLQAIIGPAKEVLKQIDTSSGVEVFPFSTTPDRWPAPDGKRQYSE